MMVADFQSCTRRIGTSQRLNSCILLHIFSIGKSRHLTLYFRTFKTTFYRLTAHFCRIRTRIVKVEESVREHSPLGDLLQFGQLFKAFVNN